MLLFVATVFVTLSSNSIVNSLDLIKSCNTDCNNLPSEKFPSPKEFLAFTGNLTADFWIDEKFAFASATYDAPIEADPEGTGIVVIINNRTNTYRYPMIYNQDKSQLYATMDGVYYRSFKTQMLGIEGLACVYACNGDKLEQFACWATSNPLLSLVETSVLDMVRGIPGFQSIKSRALSTLLT